MLDQPHHFGWADQVRRQQTERVHAEMPTVYEPWDEYRRDPYLASQKRQPWWLFALAGAGMALVVLWTWLA